MMLLIVIYETFFLRIVQEGGVSSYSERRRIRWEKRKQAEAIRSVAALSRTPYLHPFQTPLRTSPKPVWRTLPRKSGDTSRRRTSLSGGPCN